MQKVTFPNKILPYFLLAPQIVLTVVFFFWPASQAIYQSFMREDAFGLKSTFVGLANFTPSFRTRIISIPFRSRSFSTC
ncbi:glycerol-3-phosphate ABC transporter permease [Brucella inopinata]|nr:glycerol-3-phosphate ABC transporter permease [Brucella inopinata]